jgi:AraC-like DNA-binding protein
MQDSRIEQLKDFIKKFREHNPKLRRFPKSFWADVVAISDNYTIKDLAGRIGISEGPLRRKIKQRTSMPKSTPSPQFVEIGRTKNNAVLMELECPTGLTVRIFSGK